MEATGMTIAAASPRRARAPPGEAPPWSRRARARTEGAAVHASLPEEKGCAISATWQLSSSFIIFHRRGKRGIVRG